MNVTLFYKPGVVVVNSKRLIFVLKFRPKLIHKLDQLFDTANDIRTEVETSRTVRRSLAVIDRNLGSVRKNVPDPAVLLHGEQRSFAKS
jgi:hypothetical protein